jgi:hypothetical protein
LAFVVYRIAGANDDVVRENPETVTDDNTPVCIPGAYVVIATDAAPGVTVTGSCTVGENAAIASAKLATV